MQLYLFTACNQTSFCVPISFKDVNSKLPDYHEPKTVFMSFVN